MLNPVAASNTANTARWNQSMPKCHRYNGTAVSVRKNVPIKNELVVQLTRLIGMRKINAREFCGGSPARSRGPSKNNVFLFPGVHAAAVRTANPLGFQFRCWPAFFFDGAAGIRQLRRGRTAHQQAFDIGPDLWFGPSRRIKEESRRHVRVDTRYELSRCRKATSAFSLDRRL